MYFPKWKWNTVTCLNDSFIFSPWWMIYEKTKNWLSHWQQKQIWSQISHEKKFCSPSRSLQLRDQNKDNDLEAFVLWCLHNPGDMDRGAFASSFNFPPACEVGLAKFAPARCSNSCMLVKEKKANCFWIVFIGENFGWVEHNHHNYKLIKKLK